jgi:hypothetical protein
MPSWLIGAPATDGGSRKTQIAQESKCEAARRVSGSRSRGLTRVHVTGEVEFTPLCSNPAVVAGATLRLRPGTDAIQH